MFEKDQKLEITWNRGDTLGYAEGRYKGMRGDFIVIHPTGIILGRTPITARDTDWAIPLSRVVEIEILTSPL